ncbi:MAG TPA: ROK family transcriptional regulator [archaeon]|nr:ROK family transcriptional regulator [archaeon]
MITALKHVRHLNRSNILKLILTKGPISRVKIAETTGLIESTVSRIIGELIRENLVYESSRDESLIGRKPINLRFNEKYGIYGVLDVTRIRTDIAVCDLGGQFLDFKEVDTPAGNTGSFFADCVKKLARMIAYYNNKPFLGVSVIVPCSVDSYEGIIYQDEVLGWENVPVKRIVEEHIQSKVFVENNARAGALAEIYFAEEAYGLSDFVFVSFRYGIGTGIVISRRVYYGAHCMVGEFGANVIKIDGKWEDFSIEDSWENNASDVGTVRHYCELTGIPLERDIDRQLERIMNLAREGDHQAVQVLKETARELGVGIANINWGLGPERIIVGGKIVQVWEMIFPELIAQVERLTPYQVIPVRDLIIPSSLDRYTFDGARALILKELLFSDFKIVRPQLSIHES